MNTGNEFKSTGKFSNLTKNLVVMFVGLLFAFILIEIMLRVMGNPFGFRIKGDQILLPVHRQYEIHNTTNDKLDEYIVHKKNSLGFRGVEPPADFENYLTILVVGGSTTECFYLSEGQTWIDQLELNLENSFDHTWINNAGLDGHSTYGHNILMDDYVAKLRPKVVLFLVGANDMGLEELGEFDRQVQIDTFSVVGLIKSASKYSEVVSLFFNLARFFATQNQELNHGTLNLLEMPYVELSDQAREEFNRPHREKYLGYYEDRLKQLINKSREIGIEPILITQPALYGFGVDPVTGVDLARVSVNDVDGQTQWEVLELYNDVTRYVGQENNAHVIDLASVLPKDSSYFYDMLHFTPAGAKEVAEIINLELCPFLAKNYGEYQSSDCVDEAN